jgi:hypothetical protein
MDTIERAARRRELSAPPDIEVLWDESEDGVEFPDLLSCQEMADYLDRLEVTGKLSADHRDRLSDLVLQLRERFPTAPARPKRDLQRSLLFDEKRGPGQRSKLAAKIGKMIVAIDDVVRNIDAAGRDNPHLARDVRYQTEEAYLEKGPDGEPVPCVEPTCSTIDNDLRILVAAAKSIASKLHWIRSGSPATEHLRHLNRQGALSPPDSRWELMNYFVETCGITESDASDRVGVIGKAFGWFKVGVWDGDSAKPHRSPAVLNKWRRQRAARGESSKIA